MLREERISREIDRRRAAIRAVARELGGREGMSGFTMERVADESGYARTAIYRYFSSKEQLLVELAIESLEVRIELYRRAVSFEARPRERMVAFGEVTCLLYPRHVMPHVFGVAHSVLERTSEASQERVRELVQEDGALIEAVGLEAVERGDLELSFGMTLRETLFGLHALSQGVFEQVGSSPPAGSVGDPRLLLRRLGGRLLDGLGWRPLSYEWDYRSTMARIYGEVFPPQLLARLGLIEDSDSVDLRSRTTES
jgi:AcrR family transcriptional regulator